jgi:hypothetical protein
MDSADNKSKNEPLSNPSDCGQNDYLWDGSGEADAEARKFEVLLGQFRYDRPTPPVLPQIERESRWSFLGSLRFPALGLPVLASAAAAALFVAGVSYMLVRGRPTPVAGESWHVSQLEGTPRIGRSAVRAEREPNWLGIGQVLETDDHSRASLEASDTGLIEIDQNTRVRLLAMGKERKQIALDRGTIHAHIWAPPGEFVVSTPSAVTVDLGCAYTLQVNESGAGIVRTSLGWVGFKLNGREAFIPSGAACATKPAIGPGTPYFEDATAGLQGALHRFDFEDKTPQQRAEDLAIVLAQSRQRDALTLWHLLSRVDEGQRGSVYDRLRMLAPAPAGVTKEGTLRLEQPMLDLWWNALGYDDISVWRRWEHAWSEQPSNVTAGSPMKVSAK